MKQNKLGMEKAQEHTAINSIPFACLFSSYHVLGNKTKKPYSDKTVNHNEQTPDPDDSMEARRTGEERRENLFQQAYKKRKVKYGIFKVSIYAL